MVLELGQEAFEVILEHTSSRRQASAQSRHARTHTQSCHTSQAHRPGESSEWPLVISAYTRCLGDR